MTNKRATAAAFRNWLKTHGHSTETAWYLQNCLGTVFGYEHPVSKAALKAWEESRIPAILTPSHD